MPPTPPPGFEDDILTYSRAVEAQHDNIIEAFVENKPFPEVDETMALGFQPEDREMFKYTEALDSLVSRLDEPTMNPMDMHDDAYVTGVLRLLKQYVSEVDEGEAESCNESEELDEGEAESCNESQEAAVDLELGSDKVKCLNPARQFS